MKKQYFIFLAITCMVIFNVKAQNTPIDVFLKKYPSREGVTHVSMSQQMLQSIFAPPRRIENQSIGGGVKSITLTPQQKLNVPETYSSVSISKTDIPANLSTDFKKTLLSSKYEQYMEINKENNIVLGYYLKKVNDSINEIVVLRHQKDQFSTIYIKGKIDINQVDKYLSRIKDALTQMGANNTDMFNPDHQFAFSTPFPAFDNIRIHNFRFDKDSLNRIMKDAKLRMEESRREMEEENKPGMDEAKRKMEESKHMMEEIMKIFREKPQNVLENMQKQKEEGKKSMEDAKE